MRIARFTALLLGAQIVFGGIASGLHTLTFHSAAAQTRAKYETRAGARRIAADSADRIPLMHNACPVCAQARHNIPALQPPVKSANFSQYHKVTPRVPAGERVTTASTNQSRAPPIS